MTNAITLVPLTLQDHVDILQQVYDLAPGFWRMHELDSAPMGQAEQDLREADETPSRTIMGIVHRMQADDPESGHEMIGMVDFRINWPREGMTHLGMLMVAEPYQRLGVGTQTLHLLQPWLANSAGIGTIRIGVEQFNTGALLFFQQIGFDFTGDTSRVNVGERWIRLLFMEKQIGADKNDIGASDQAGQAE